MSGNVLSSWVHTACMFTWYELEVIDLTRNKMKKQDKDYEHENSGSVSRVGRFGLEPNMKRNLQAYNLVTRITSVKI